MNLLPCDANTLSTHLKIEPQRARDLRAPISAGQARDLIEP